jgi:hypothetical protein
MNIKKMVITTLFSVLSTIVSLGAQASCQDNKIYTSINLKSVVLIAECKQVIQLDGPHGNPDLCVFKGKEQSSDFDTLVYVSSDLTPWLFSGQHFSAEKAEDDNKEGTFLSDNGVLAIGTNIIYRGDFGRMPNAKEVLTYDRYNQRLTVQIDGYKDSLLGGKWVPGVPEIFGCQNISNQQPIRFEQLSATGF